jgi:hypothetical protein
MASANTNGKTLIGVSFQSVKGVSIVCMSLMEVKHVITLHANTFNKELEEK